MTTAVVNLTERQARPWINRARDFCPLITDEEAERLLTSGLTTIGIKAELFRMVARDPAWLATIIANDNRADR